MGTIDLPDIYTRARGPLGPSASVYISGKSLVPMLQLIYSTWVTHLQVLESAGLPCEFYLYWPLLTSNVVNDIRATALMLVRIYRAITSAHATTISHIVLQFVDLGFFTVMDIVMYRYNELTRSAHSFVVGHTSSVVINNPL